MDFYRAISEFECIAVYCFLKMLRILRKFPFVFKIKTIALQIKNNHPVVYRFLWRCVKSLNVLWFSDFVKYLETPRNLEFFLYHIVYILHIIIYYYIVCNSQLKSILPFLILILLIG